MFRLPIGAFSDLVFECSSERVFTFDDYKRESKARYAKHELINQSPALEFLGADVGEITFSMIFSDSLGVDPAQEAQRVRDLCEYGVADFLIIGNEVFGDNMWVIERFEEEAKAFDESARIILSSIKVTPKEYVATLPS